MRALADRLADGQDEIVERITYQLSAYRPCGATLLGPAEITGRIALLVGDFIESLHTRRVAPFVDRVRAMAEEGPEGERLAGAELQTALDLLEDLALQSVTERTGLTPPEASFAIRSLVDAGRSALPAETR